MRIFAPPRIELMIWRCEPWVRKGDEDDEDAAVAKAMMSAPVSNCIESERMMKRLISRVEWVVDAREDLARMRVGVRRSEMDLVD
jgi:hypothetical protein